MKKFLLLILITVCFISSSAILFGQKGKDKSKEERNQLFSAKLVPQYSNSEKELGRIITNKSNLKERSALAEQLHQARQSGNLELVKQIEARLLKAKLNTGESMGETITRVSNSKGYPGEPLKYENNSKGIEAFGTDIPVRSVNLDFRESYPSMATASDGTIYIVWENIGGTSLPNDYLQIYKSTDDGNSWNAFGYIQNATYNLSQPSLAIGEGSQNLLVLAYVVDDLTVPYVEIATTTLSSFNTTMVVPSYLSFWESYQKPTVWTDSYDWNGWYIYLTTEATFNLTENNMNVVYWRSTDFGASFSFPDAVFGKNDIYEWLDPDGTYGCLGNDVFIASYNATDNNLYMVKSSDFGLTWMDTVQVNNINPIPTNHVDLDIEAATNQDNLMLVCTISNGSDDDIGQCYSTDAGSSWTILYALEGHTTVNEFAVDLQANEGGNNWHLAYTTQDWWVYYSTRPQDLSDYWQLVPDLINDVDWASAQYSKKTVTSNWSSDQPGVSWSDYRDPTAGDYDIYFDYNSPGEPNINVTPTSLTINQPKDNTEIFDNGSLSFTPGYFFTIADRNKASISLEERYRLVNFESLETSIQTKLVTADLEMLSNSEGVKVNLFNGKEVTLKKERITYRGRNDFSWFAETLGEEKGSAIIVRNGDALSGSIKYGNENYAIRTVGSGYYILIRQDLTNLPQEHPPEFEEILNSKSFKDFDLMQMQEGMDNTKDDGSFIDVLVAYTPSAASAAGNMTTLIQLAIDESNQGYQNSNVFPRVNLVYSYEVSYSESGSFDTDLTRFRTDGDGYMDEVHTYRDTYSADVCVIIIDNTAYCGLASTIMADASTAFCAVHWDCATGYYSFAHEIGHLQGARHNPEADPSTSPFAYGHGYLYAAGGWRTVMSYNHSSCPSGYCTRVNHWSNPDINYSSIPTGTSATHDNARVLDETAYTVANFRVSSTAANTITIQNVGTATLTVTGITDDKSWLLHSGYPSTPFDLAPSASQVVSISVDWNLISSSDVGTITIASNDPDEPNVIVTVTANPTEPSGPLSIFDQWVDDDNTGNSLGNSDGLINPGESVELYVELTNSGTVTATGVQACLSDDSPYTTFTFNDCSLFDDIPGGSYLQCLNDYDIDISPAAPIGHKINFTLDITASNGGPWTEYFTMIVTADPPDIDITPTSFVFNVDAGGSDTQTLTIENTAPDYSQALLWNIFDNSTSKLSLENGNEVPIKLERQHKMVSSSPKSQLSDVKYPIPQVDENIAKFDYLVESQAIEAATDISKISSNERLKYFPTVSATETLLYDNGPIINSPGTGYGGADESVLQTSLSMFTYGFGHHVSYGYRIADDFTVTDPSGWIIDSFVFYAYQSYASTTSTITSVNYRIWDGPPGAPGSNIIAGDTVSNRLLQTEWSGIFRIQEGMVNDTNRAVMLNTVAAGYYLPPGVYWLDWQSDGSSFSGPWVPPITVNGQTTTGNGLLYDGSWNAVIDVGQQGLPFRINGTAASDLPWLTEDPIAGITPPMMSNIIDITVDASTLTNGTYTAELIVTSNDPDENPLTIPVTVNVGSTSGDFDATVTVIDNCANSQGLMFGTAPDATDGFDAAYDQYAPPPPPAGAFDARFRIGADDLLKDFRKTIASDPIEWTVIYQPSSGCTPVELNWNPAELPSAGVFRLVDGITGGTLVDINMRDYSSYSDAAGYGQMKIIYSITDVFHHQIYAGWNMLGIPLAHTDRHYLSIFPNAVTGTLFGFSGGYYSTDTLEYSIGYWLKFNNPEIALVEGLPFISNSIDLDAGWNMISGLSCNVAVSDIGDPGGIIVAGTLFGFTGSYFPTDTLKQGGGYWLKTSSAGTISMNCGTKLAKNSTLALRETVGLDDFNSIEITSGKREQTLYFGGKLAKGINPESFQLPPTPPAGSFDVRFTGGYWLTASAEATLNIQALEYPLIVDLSFNDNSTYLIRQVSGSQVIEENVVAASGQINVNNRAVNQLQILRSEPVSLEFELSQNYPNPFNPETVIRFSIPEQSNVQLIIYDALGQIVTTLVSELKEAGIYSEVWNGKNDKGESVGSGIYFYGLKTANDHIVKKLVLLK